MLLLAPREAKPVRKLRRRVANMCARLAFLNEEITVIRQKDPCIGNHKSSFEDVYEEPSALCQTYRGYIAERAQLKVDLSNLEDELEVALQSA